MLQTLAKMGDAQESKYGKSFLGHAGERRGVRRTTDILYEAYNTTENQWGKQQASMAISVAPLTLISKY